MPKAARKTLALAAYLLGVVLFCEGSARLALGSDAFFKRVAGDDEASWRLRWAARQRKQGRIYYDFDVYHETRGWALLPGVRNREVYPGKLLSSNARGLRGSTEYPYERRAGVPRVLVLGDSFTFGEDVADEETYCQRLEQALPGVEVLNLGVHGYGQDQMLVYLREEGLKYRPDVVVLGFLSDDMERNLLAFRDYGKPRFVLDGGRLVLTGTPVPPPEVLLASEARRSKFADLLTMLFQRWRTRSGALEREARRLGLAILDAIAEETRGIGATPVFAYLPVYGEITKPDMAMTARERFFFSYCRERGIQSTYLRPFFLKKMKQGTEFKAYGHWGPQEHRTAAEGIAAYLVEKGVIQAPHP